MFCAIVRCLQGNGFAQDTKAKEGDNVSSEVFAQLLRQLYEDDKASGGNVVSDFINKLFNNLNWTVSELEVAMRNVRGLYSLPALLACRADVRCCPFSCLSLRRMLMLSKKSCKRSNDDAASCLSSLSPS
jgi:hypothetical protein